MERSEARMLVVIVSMIAIGLFVALLVQRSPERIQEKERLPSPKVVVVAKLSPGNAQGKEWSRLPKRIAFQNDSQREDSRWQQTNVGPFLSASIEANKRLTLKGIAIRVGDHGQASVCFDTAKLRFSGIFCDAMPFPPARVSFFRRQ